MSLDRESLEEIVRRARELHNYVVELRRDFHMHPELAYEEVRTSSVVEKELRKLGFKTVRAARTGVIGVLEGEKSGPVVALRADMDALPVNELNDVPYKSRIPGKMHACGHDAHTAMLLGAAHILADVRSRLKGKVKLVFQPAEEGGLGAKKIVEDGHIDDVSAVFGMHVWIELPSGTIGIRKGPFLASADAFKIVVKGKGGHGASPHTARDPIAAILDVGNAIYRIISREVDPLEPAVISITRIEAGTTYNVIPEEAMLMGTIRTFNEDVRNYIVRRMKEIVEGYTKSLGLKADLQLEMEYNPPTINNPELADFAKRVLEPLNIAKIVEPKPTMGAEDFAFYAKKVPSLFIALGIRNEKKGIIYPHHNPRFDVDEDVLWIGTAVYAVLAYTYLATKP